MQQLKILNTREKENLLKDVCEKFGTDAGQFKELVFMESENEIWVASKQCLMQDLGCFTVDSIGMLFARKNKQIELTVNAVQMFCSKSSNTLNLGTENALTFIQGLSLTIEKPDGVYIVSCRKNALDLGEVKNHWLKRKSKK